MDEKLCTDCNKLLPATKEFFYERSDVNKLTHTKALFKRCKLCHNIKVQSYRPVKPKKIGLTEEEKRTLLLKKRSEHRAEIAKIRGAVGSRVCRRCSIEKPIQDFTSNKRCDAGYGYRCISCCNEKELERNTKLRINHWPRILVDSNRQAAKRFNREFTITVEDVKDLYKKQNGRCYWFNVPIEMTLERRHPLKPSLDRLDATKGYTLGNVVLTCMAANFGRNTATAEVFEAFVDRLKTDLPKRGTHV